MSNYTGFRGVTHYGEPLLTNELETNLKSWLDWCFLAVGAWKNVTIPTSGVYGGNFHTLQEIDDRSYTNNTVFQGIRKDWIWESGVNYASPTGGTFNPLSVEVYVGGSLKT